MGFYRILPLLIIFSLAAAGEIVESVAARLNGTVFTYSEILQEHQLLNIENNIPIDTPPTVVLKKKILDLLVIRDILFIEAKDRNVFLSEKKIKAKFDYFMKQPQIDLFMKRFELNRLAFLAIVKKRLLADKMTEEFLKREFKDPEVSRKKKEAAVERWYDHLRKKHKIAIYPIP